MSEEKNVKKRSLRSFFADALRGVGIGVAFIIPGFSGGSVAAMLGIYEKLINAIAGILKEFKKNFITLLPIALGLVFGALALLFPLEWALGKFPFPTVSLFVGLTIGCIPTLLPELRGKIRWTNLLALFIPMVLTVMLSFAPLGNEINLYSLNFWGYALLIPVGIVGSAALVIPGISGSMLLLMLGYYNPVVGIVTDLIRSLTEGTLFSAETIKSFIVILMLGLGIVIGFFGISLIMKGLFKKCRRGTFFAIVGFIIGSLPTVFSSTYKEAGYTPEALPSSPAYWIACPILLIIGVATAYGFILLSRKKSNK